MRRTRLLVVDLNGGRLPQREAYRLLAARGFEALVLAPQVWQEAYGPVAFEPEPARPGYRAQALPVRFNGKYHRVLFAGLEDAVREFQPEHLWAIAEPENWLAWQARRALLRQAPAARLSLVSWRNIDYPRNGLPYKLAGLHQRLEDASRDAGEQVLCYNREAELILGGRGFRCTPTRMGVNLAYFKPGPQAAARQALGLPLKAKLVGFAGRCIEAKGGADLVDAVAALRGAELLLLGDGPERAAWQARAAGLGLTVHHRALKHEQMPAGLRALDVLALPSRSTPGWLEQFGRVLVEAMACGTPVVGSDSGAIPQVIGRAGWVHKEGDVPSLKGALALALAKGASKRRAGFARAKQFEWQAIVPELARAFPPLPALPSVPLHGVPVFKGDAVGALDAVMALLRARRGGSVCYLNAHLAVLAAKAPALRRALREADLVLPDGGGILLAGTLLGRPLPERLALGDLLGPIAQNAQRAGAKSYFWGAEPGVAEAAAKALGLKLAGNAHGFQRTEAELKAVIAGIRRSGARLCFLGMGSPKQELLARRLRAELPGLLVIVCGNAFTYAAGLQSRAPRWMQAASMEWLWRLGQEPGRLWERYLIGNASFLFRTAWQMAGGQP